jgi:DNA-directed RNA polymerase subunit RPC12/RpoP
MPRSRPPQVALQRPGQLEIQMTLKCGDCGSTFSETSLDGAARKVCPVCNSCSLAPLVSDARKGPSSKSAPPFSWNPIGSIHLVLRARAAKKRGESFDPRDAVQNSAKPAPLRQRIRRGTVLGISILFVAMSLFVSIGSCRKSSVVKSSARWPTTIGTISTCSVREVRVRSRWSWNAEVRYTVDIVYSYNVDGVKFTGDQISASRYWWDSETAFKKVVKYDPGSTHPVSFDPKNPKASVLEPGDDGPNYRDYLENVTWPVVVMLVACMGLWLYLIRLL